MTKTIKRHIQYNTMMIHSKIIITSLFIMMINLYIGLILLLLSITYETAFYFIKRSSKTFEQFLRRTRKLMLIYFIFQQPSYLAFDFKMYETIKKEKYTKDAYWLYKYIYRREFEIHDKEQFKKDVHNSFQHLLSRVKKIQITGVFIAVIGLILYYYTKDIVYIPYAILGITFLTIYMTIHNTFMWVMIKRNHFEILQLFEQEKYNKALRLSIFYLGMTKRKFYKAKQVSYLKHIESIYMY